MSNLIQASTSTPKSKSMGSSVLDLSFRSLLNIQDVADEIERSKNTGIKKSKESGKLLCTALRLNNNNINDLTGLSTVLEAHFHDVNAIEWVDLSFNDLHSITEHIDALQNLKVLYLHGNTIEKLQDVDRLASLGELKSLTLHGNPVESCKGYRQYILSTLPLLKNLDFSGVTKQDRSTADTWKKSQVKKPKERKSM